MRNIMIFKCVKKSVKRRWQTHQTTTVFSHSRNKEPVYSVSEYFLKIKRILGRI